MNRPFKIFLVGDLLSGLLGVILVVTGMDPMNALFFSGMGGLLTLAAINTRLEKRMSYLPEMFVYALLNLAPIFFVFLFPIATAVAIATYFVLDFLFPIKETAK